MGTCPPGGLDSTGLVPPRAGSGSSRAGKSIARRPLVPLHYGNAPPAPLVLNVSPVKSAAQTWLVLGLTLLLVITVRVRLRATPLERDEGEYAYAGQLMLQGVPPYKEVYNMKLPGTYAAYAVIMAILGQTPSAIHLGLLAVNVASILLIFLLGRRLLDTAAGLAAAVSFALLSLSPSVLGLAGHATHFIALFAVAGMLLLLYACPLEVPSFAGSGPPGLWLSRSSVLFASGLLLGLAFLMKQHGAFFGLLGVALLLWERHYAQSAGRDENQKAKRRPHHHRRHTRHFEPPPVPVVRAKNLMAAALERAAAGAQTPAPASEAPIEAQKTTNPVAPATGVAQSARALATEASSASGTSAPRPGEATHEPAWAEAPRASAPETGRRAGDVMPRLRISQIALFCAGLALPYLVTCLLLALTGAFPQFRFWTLTYAAKYASAIPFSDSESFLSTAWSIAIGPALLFWLLALAGAVLMWWDERLTAAHRFFLSAFLLCSLASISVGFYFRPHYFITLLPVLAVLLGITVSRAMSWLRGEDAVRRLLAVPILLLFGVGIFAVLAGNGQLWFSLSPAEVSRETYGTTLFTRTAELARELKAETPAAGRIAVLGSEPEIYFLSHRRAATGYIYTYPLMEAHPYARTMQQNMIQEIERARPDYVVYVDDPMSWLQTPDSDLTIFNWWHTNSTAQFDLVKRLDVARGREPAELMQREPGSAPGLPPTGLYVFKRRSP